jgi:hypothetical protein
MGRLMKKLEGFFNSGQGRSWRKFDEKTSAKRNKK